MAVRLFFWEDLWLGEVRLKEKFPRLFSISLQQLTPISECGSWDGSVWHWNLLWRMEFFIWELQFLQQLNEMLEQTRLFNDQVDKVWWPHDSSGRFSTQSMVKKLYEMKVLATQTVLNINIFWRGLVPPKAELLLWFALQGRLNIMDRLRRLGVLRNEDYRCVLCRQTEETLPHLLYTCDFSWKVWGACCSWWGIDWVFSGDSAVNFESWIAVKAPIQKKKLWISCYYVVVWSLWNLRNMVLFQKKKVCWQSFMVELWYRYKYWCST